VLVAANPLEYLTALCGTGAIRLNDATGRVERVGAVTYTIKDGIVYDAARRLDDVARIVKNAKKAASP